jgi:MFS transporter, Spinster family, sphingosine-1-phosphate transporter
MGRTPDRRFLLGILLLILAFNYVDRLALGLLLQDIKRDLALSDTELGFLGGIAFALFYSVMGIPIARWADRGDRVLIITVTTALWSAAVAFCGAATSFAQLLLIRVGVAIGEAGCVPPAHSLIADYFSRAERPRAVAIYMLGTPLSFVIGYFVAGWLNQLYGWRMTFVLLGLPGLALAGLAWFGLQEPRRRAQAHASVQTPRPSLRQVVQVLWANRTFRHLLLCLSVAQFFGYGILQWKPAFFMRSFGLETGELGTWFAAIYGIGGVAGTYLGGVWASRHAGQNEALQLRTMAVAYCVFAVLSAGIYLSSDLHLSLACMAIATIGVGTTNGPMFATIQTLVPEEMRAVSIAFVYLSANLIGMGAGPIAAGVLSDLLRPAYGDESLRYALLVLCPGYLWAAWHLWRGSKTVFADLPPAEASR